MGNTLSVYGITSKVPSVTSAYVLFHGVLDRKVSLEEFERAVANLETVKDPKSESAYKRLTEAAHVFANMSTAEVGAMASPKKRMAYCTYTLMRARDSVTKSMTEERAIRLLLRLFKLTILKLMHPSETYLEDAFQELYSLCELPSLAIASLLLELKSQISLAETMCKRIPIGLSLRNEGERLVRRAITQLDVSEKIDREEDSGDITSRQVNVRCLEMKISTLKAWIETAEKESSKVTVETSPSPAPTTIPLETRLAELRRGQNSSSSTSY